MKVTVCQLNTEYNKFSTVWKNLVDYLQHEKSDLVLLPEMTFYKWFASSKNVDLVIWDEAVNSHLQWAKRLPELNTDIVISTKPMNDTTTGKRINMGYIWTKNKGIMDIHNKVYLPNEEGFWEANWYDRGNKIFKSVEINGTKIGFAICTELWFMEHAREYCEQGIHFLVCPRATPIESLHRWILAGQTAAIISGSFCLSSNHRGKTNTVELGGEGWIIDPEGNILGKTSDINPFFSVTIDPKQADAAKETYPRYVKR